MKSTVVIPAYNEEKSIKETLSSLKKQETEVIVVAGGEDNTKKAAEEHPATDRVLEDKKNKGAGAARNQGAEAAEGKVILFTDADTVLPEDWVEKHKEHYDNQGGSNIVGVGGPLKPKEDRLKHKILFKILSDWWYRICWPIGFVQLTGNNCSYRKKDFLEEEGFNEEISFMEDTELSLRMKKYGKLAYDKRNPVKTSTRRQDDNGYIRTFLTYLKGYFDYYILGKDPETTYFASSK